MAYHRSQQQPICHPTPDKNYLLKIFQAIDTDRSGNINAIELQKALSNGTWKEFNPETVRMMIGMFDRDGKSTINFNEFVALWKYVVDWQNCFRTFDTDNSGAIDKSELRQALHAFGYRFTDKFIDLVVRKFDRLGKGHVAFDDFIQACVTIENLTGAFRRFDYKSEGKITIEYEEFLTLVFNLKI